MLRISEIAPMTFIFILIFLSYFVTVFGLITGWIKAIHPFRSGIVKEQFISIIVPFRNEENNLSALLSDLQQQAYPREKFEVVLVNDHSEDNSKHIIRANGGSQITIRSIDAEGHGKKAAITEGIQQAEGKIIVTTDADCRLNPGWIRSINNSFSDDTIKMIFGPVKIQPDQSLLSSMQAIEFSSLVGSGAATAAFGFPTLCNGANLAFTKEAFLQTEGYVNNQHIASGDDEFLMRKVEAKFPNAIRFNADPGGIVTTQPQKTIKDFLIQRLRWAGKWRHHEGTNSKLLAVYIFLFHVSFIMLPLFVLLGDISIYIMLSLLMAKAFIEYYFLKQVSKWLGVTWHWPSFLLLEVIYSLYAVGVALVALFKVSRWKGRPVIIE